MRKIILLLFMMCSLASMTWAQRNITGAVTDAKGAPLIAATVQEKGMTNGVVTDNDGRYALTVKDGATLVFSYVGYTDQEATISASNVLNVTLAEGKVLTDVVVTALGIKRSEKTLGYAAQTVSGSSITGSNAGNIVDGLSGQAAGVQVIRSSGAAGGGTFVQLRGQNTLTGDVQPLIVVDGIVMDNSTNDINSDGQSGVGGNPSGTAASNRAVDINPNDIESVTVLKGGAAAALYGIRAANGVLVYTTKKGTNKKGKKGLTVDLNSSVTVSRVSQLPALQNKYLQGTGGKYYDAGTTESSGRSWGPLADTMYWDGNANYDYDSNGALVGKSDPSKKTPFVPYDNTAKFYRTGLMFNNSIAVNGGDENASFRISGSNMSEQGIIPLNTFQRTTVGMSGQAKINDKWSTSGSITYSNSGGYRVQQGSNTAGIQLGLYRTPISFDNSNGATDATDPRAYTYPNLPVTVQRTYRANVFDNPYWVINNSPEKDNVSRYYGNIGVNYKILDWLTASFKSGIDNYTDSRSFHYAMGSNANIPDNGRIIEDRFIHTTSDNYINLIGDKQLNKDFRMNFNVGGNYYRSFDDENKVQSDGLTIPGYYNPSSGANLGGSGQNTSRIHRYGAFASTDFSFRNMLYLGLTGRNDWSSVLPINNRSFFYPSANLGFIFADGNDGLVKSSILSFGKLRASYAVVASDGNTPYRTKRLFTSQFTADGWTAGVQFPQNGQVGFVLNPTLGNDDLKPETTISKEFGLDVRFFGGRLGLDVAYYDNLSQDLIVPVTIAASSGASRAILNSGAIQSTGIEAVLTAIPVKTKNFTWSTTVNFARNRSIVQKLYGSLPELKFLDGFGAGTVQIPGEQVNQIYGNDYIRDKNGAIVLDDSKTPATNKHYGYPFVSTKTTALGNPNPDFTLGWNNTVNYKSFSLSFLFDWKSGGQMWNGTRAALNSYGMSKETEDRGQMATFSGVKLSSVDDGTGNADPTKEGKEWNIDRPHSEYYYKNIYNTFTGLASPFVEKTDWLRFRTLTVGYQIPSKALDNSPFGKLGFSLTARNLFLWTPYTGVDPESSLTGNDSHTQGLEYFNTPAVRSIMFGLNATF